MASNSRQAEVTHDSEHPEDSVLLAYLRRQHLQDYLKINQHIDVEQCPRCRHRCNELAQISATLEVLAQMPQYQHYPERSVDRTYEHVQRAANKRNPLRAYLDWAGNRQRPRMSVIRLVSLPLALVLALLCAMLVFAYLSDVSLPGLLQGGIFRDQSGLTSVVRQHITPTPNLALTATAKAEVSPTVTASAAPKPNIAVCSTPADVAHSRLVICGSNFEPGHKVSLVVTWSGRMPVTLNAVPVDMQGGFQYRWYVFNCRFLPTAIVAYEVGNKKISSNVLVNISFTGCFQPTPTPTSTQPGP